LNFIQLYIGYIGASRAYGMHFELMDVALFLTNQGITVYWGHKHRWSHKWRIRMLTAPVSTVAPAQLSKSRTPRRVVAAASGAFAGAAQALASPVVHVPSYTPVISVVPLTRGDSKSFGKPPVINAPRRESRSGAVESSDASAEKVRAPAEAV
jgi:hypothetical protein